MKPRVAFQVPNTLTGEGNMSVDITFDSMDDFSPAAIARKVDSLNKLLEARNQLQNLVTYMDGKTGAEELVSKVLADPALHLITWEKGYQSGQWREQDQQGELLIQRPRNRSDYAQLRRLADCHQHRHECACNGRYLLAV